MVPKFSAIPSFSEIIAQIGEAIWVIGPTGHWVYVNPTFARFIGIHEEEVYSHALLEYVHPDDKEECAGLFEQLKHGSDIGEARYRLVHRDGFEVWVSSVITAVRDAAREVQYFVGTSRKVSGDKIEYPPSEAPPGTQRALPGLPDIPFDELISIMAEPVWVIDGSRHFVFTNPAFNLLVGYSSDELAGKKLTDVMVVEKRDELDEGIRRIIEGEEMTKVAVSIVHRGGNEIESHFLVKPIRSDEGGITYFIGSNRGMSDVVPGSALPDPSGPYRAALEKMGIPAWLTDSKGNWIIVNGPFAALVGVRQDETIPLNLPGIIHPDDQGLIKNALADLNKTDTVKLSCRLQPGAGKEYWVDVVLSSVRIDSGDLTYILGTAHDLTNERMLEASVSQLRDKLQDMIDQLDDAVMATDKMGKIKVMNKNVPELLDKMDFEILEQDLAGLFPSEYANNVHQAISKSLAGNKGSATIEVEIGGVRCPCTFKYAPLHHSGEIEGVMVILKKI